MFRSVAHFSAFSICIFVLLISSGLPTCSTRKRNRHLADFPQEARAALDFFDSSKFSSVVFKAGVPHQCSIGSCSGQIHCEIFTHSTLSSLHNSVISSSLRSSSPLHCLSHSSIFYHTSVLLDAQLFMDFSSVCMPFALEPEPEAEDPPS